MLSVEASTVSLLWVMQPAKPHVKMRPGLALFVLMTALAARGKMTNSGSACPQTQLLKKLLLRKKPLLKMTPLLKKKPRLKKKPHLKKKSHLKTPYLKKERHLKMRPMKKKPLLKKKPHLKKKLHLKKPPMNRKPLLKKKQKLKLHLRLPVSQPQMLTAMTQMLQKAWPQCCALQRPWVPRPLGGSRAWGPKP